MRSSLRLCSSTSYSWRKRVDIGLDNRLLLLLQSLALFVERIFEQLDARMAFAPAGSFGCERLVPFAGCCVPGPCRAWPADAMLAASSSDSALAGRFVHVLGAVIAGLGFEQRDFGLRSAPGSATKTAA